MLILTRKEQERIFIGDNVILTVIGIRPGQVKLMFECSKVIPIDREEVRLDKISTGNYQVPKPNLHLNLYDASGTKVMVEWIPQHPYFKVTRSDLGSSLVQEEVECHLE